MLSAISTAGILPENVAPVYPYVTFAMYLRPSCRAFKTLRNAFSDTVSVQRSTAIISLTLSSLMPFIACLTMTRVSSISVSILPSNPFLTCGFTYIIPFGATEN